LLGIELVIKDRVQLMSLLMSSITATMDHRDMTSATIEQSVGGATDKSNKSVPHCDIGHQASLWI